MEIEKLNEWNPWWEENRLIENLTGKHRPKYDLLVKSVDIKEITIITGIRRAGKSTLMYQMIDNLLKKVEPFQILFVNLEDKKFTKDSLEDIYKCYRKYLNPDKKAFIFLDEIHKKEEWESWVRKKYDIGTNDKFIISGSCSYLLKREYSTLLTGRNLTFEIFPLGFEEFLLFRGIEFDKKKIGKGIVSEKTKNSILKKLKEYMNLGGFPEITFKQKQFQMKILKQYFDDILFKDIIDRYNLNSQKTEDLALFLITNSSNLISLRNMRGSLKMSYDTIKDYISYFQEAFLFFRLSYFSYSLKEQSAFAPKIYCIDNGLRNAVSFKFSKDEGKLAENLVFIELKRRGKDVYYWKNAKHHEVDFVVKNEDGSLGGVNVCYSDDINGREMRGLLEFKKELKNTKDIIILTKDLEKIERIDKKNIKFIPLWKWLIV